MGINPIEIPTEEIPTPIHLERGVKVTVVGKKRSSDVESQFWLFYSFLVVFVIVEMY